MDDIAIKVDNVSKVFKLPHERHTSIKSTVVNFYRHRRSYEKQQALKDVSFEVRKGEFFGIVGRNGSGKSTMLKTLAGIYVPTKGSVQINGKLTPFIELGVGFNPELSGRDNVFLNGALLGFNRKEMQKMYDDIVEFAELEKFMGQKLKNYSSGMQVRLAFSIAIRANSDILLIDEVLAVGDEAFQRKCLDVFEIYKANRKTVVLVTHDMGTVRQFCNRAMLINEGKLVDIGNPHSITDQYSKLNEEQALSSRHPVVAGTESKHLKLKLKGTDDSQKQIFDAGDTARFEVTWAGLPATDFESIGFNIFKLSGEHITGINTRDSRLSNGWKNAGKIVLELKLDLNDGKYFSLVEIFSKPGATIDRLDSGQFSVRKNTAKWSGLAKLPYKWHEGSQNRSK